MSYVRDDEDGVKKVFTYPLTRIRSWKLGGKVRPHPHTITWSVTYIGGGGGGGGGDATTYVYVLSLRPGSLLTPYMQSSSP